MAPPLIALPARFTDKADTWRVPAYAVGRPYCDAIVRAGGVPVVFTPHRGSVASLAKVLARFDGVLLPGGPDVAPERYTDVERHPTVYGVVEEHDELDLALARSAVELGLPLLAICRGHQVLNVALGGSLHQHIGDDEAAEHRFRYHEVSLATGCRAATLMGTTTPIGHSVHHQAIDRVGDGLVVTARAADGIVEAIEMPDRFVMGVQWHPEDSADHDPQQQALFDGLVRAATR